MTRHIDWNEFLQFSIALARMAGAIQMDYLGKLTEVHHKSNVTDMVTRADLESEELIVQSIREQYPDHDIIAEESAVLQQGSPFRWVIDPLDGTTNYVHGLPLFGVSIGLQYNENSVVGAVYNPAMDEMYTASAGAGAFLNGESIHVSNTDRLINAILVTGFPYEHDDLWHLSFDLLHDLHDRVQGMRRLGAAALDLCLIARGVLDGFYEFRLCPWDVCAGEIILREAGGMISDWDGGFLPFSGSRVLATNGAIHYQLRDVLTSSKYQAYFSL